MNKRKIKITAVITVVVILLASLCAGAVSLIVEDSMFKNNTPTYITPNSQTTGIIKNEDDYEAYILEVPASGALVVRLDHEDFIDNTKTAWKVKLYKIIDEGTRSYKELSYTEVFWSDATSNWGEVGVTEGTYCVVVSSGAFFLESEFTLVTMFTQTDIYEKEPNDTVEEATLMQVKYGKYGSSQGREQSADVDWFTFELQEDSCIDISFTHSDNTFPTVGWNVTLMNNELETITQFTSRLNETVVKTGVIGLKSGTYYVKVDSQTNNTDTYTLLIGADKAVNNEFELNDTPESAILLPCDLTVSGSLSDRLLGLDKDYYKFTVPADGYIDFEFTHELLEGDKKGWNIRIIKPMEDGSYFEIVRKISMWNEESYIIENLGLAAGDYYVCIDGDSVSYNSATYTCKWSFSEKQNFEKEPNNTLESAENIVFGTYYHGAVISTDMTFDEDFYKFELSEATRICLEFGHETGDSGDICWTASIVDENGNEVTSVDSAVSAGLASTGVMEVPAGTYYVKIETGVYGSEIPYYFRLVR